MCYEDVCIKCQSDYLSECWVHPDDAWYKPHICPECRGEKPPVQRDEALEEHINRLTASIV